MGWRLHYCDPGAEKHVSFVTLRAIRFHLTLLPHALSCVSAFPGRCGCLHSAAFVFIVYTDGYIIRPIVYHDSDRQPLLVFKDPDAVTLCLLPCCESYHLPAFRVRRHT